MKQEYGPQNSIMTSEPMPLSEFGNVENYICSNFAEILKTARDMGFDEIKFTDRLMQSDFCRREMDADYSVFQMADPEECMDFILKEFTPEHSEDGYEYTDAILEWIGYAYEL